MTSSILQKSGAHILTWWQQMKPVIYLSYRPRGSCCLPYSIEEVSNHQHITSFHNPIKLLKPWTAVSERLYVTDWLSAWWHKTQRERIADIFLEIQSNGLPILVESEKWVREAQQFFQTNTVQNQYINDRGQFCSLSLTLMAP